MPLRGFSAQSTLLLLLATLAAVAPGCQRLPIRGFEPADEKPLNSTVTGAVDRGERQSKPAELPPLPSVPLVPKDSTNVAPAPAPAAEPAPTPLLDAAISRANHLDEVVREVDDEGVEGTEVPDLKESVETTPSPQPAKTPPPSPAPSSKESDQPPIVSAPEETGGLEHAPKLAPEEMTRIELPPLGTPPAPIARSPLSTGTAGLFAPPPVEPAQPRTLDLAPTDPRDDWNQGLERLRELARLRADQAGDEAEAWSIRARLLDHLAGADDPDGANGEAWTSVLIALSTAPSAETPDQSVLSLRMIEAVDALEALQPLRITEFMLCRKVLGFGAFEPLDPMTIRSGQPIILYCELSGLRYAFEDGTYRSRITSKLELVKGEGGQVVWSLPLGSADDLCRRRRRDFYVNYKVNVPTSVPPGPYRLRITQTDLVGQQTTDTELRVALHSDVTPAFTTR